MPEPHLENFGGIVVLDHVFQRLVLFATLIVPFGGVAHSKLPTMLTVSAK